MAHYKSYAEILKSKKIEEGDIITIKKDDYVVNSYTLTSDWNNTLDDNLGGTGNFRHKLSIAKGEIKEDSDYDGDFVYLRNLLLILKGEEEKMPSVVIKVKGRSKTIDLTKPFQFKNYIIADDGNYARFFKDGVFIDYSGDFLSKLELELLLTAMENKIELKFTGTGEDILVNYDYNLEIGCQTFELKEVKGVLALVNNSKVKYKK